MKTHIQNLFFALAFFALNLSTATVQAQGTAFTYQGQLNSAGSPATGSYDLSFTVYDDPNSGNLIGTVTNYATAVSNGLFATTLDFGGVFTGTNYWLEIAAQTNNGNGFTTLSPRQQFTPVPYAEYASNAGTAQSAASASSVAATNISGALTTAQLPMIPTTQLSGTLTTAQLPSAVVTNNENNVNLVGTFSGNGTNLTISASQLSGGTIPQSVLSGFQWPNYQTVGGGEFNSAGASNTVVGGGYQNTASGEYASVVGGGYNTASGEDATVGGGGNNIASVNSATVGGGANNTASGQLATVGGGGGNTASGQLATVGGGGSNTAINNYATVGGGNDNTASGNYATVGGGSGNSASGNYATVSGGYENVASGDYSFAAGNGAKVVFSGSFVWEDDSTPGTPFVCSAANQFLIQAAGGVGIGTNNPATALDVNGTVTATAFSGNGSRLTGLSASALPSTVVTNNETSVTLSGTFSGNGGGLTNLNVSVTDTNENLRQLRGIIKVSNASILGGSGFSLTKNGTGDYTITYAGAFNGFAFPNITVQSSAGPLTPNIVTTTTGSFEVRFYNSSATLTDPDYFGFTVAGAR